MGSESRISASISKAALERLDRFRKSRGLTKDFVVGQALLYFMDACRELPDEALVPTRLVLDDATFDRIAELIASPPTATAALHELMSG